MIVINVFASLNSGGAENRMMDVYRNIDREKFQFHFITLSLEQNQYFEQEILSLGGKVIKIASPRDVGIFKHIKTLIDIFRQYDVSETVVHSHSLYHSGVVMYAAKKAGLKIRIAHARASQSRSKGLKNEFFICIGKFLIRKYATHRLAVSVVAGKYLFGKSKFVVIPNAIDISRYTNFSDDERSKYMREFNITDNEVVIGHIGRLEPVKNHEFILKIFKGFHEKNVKSKLIMVGDGKLRNQIQNDISHLHIEESVVMCGIRRDANRLINIFDVIIFPSFNEGMPGVILEAQAAGIPCILSNNITREVDLGLGLLKFLNLSNADEWERWLETWRPIVPVLSDRVKAFDCRNLSVKSEISILTKIYSLCK